MPLISIIVTTYNRKDFLLDTLNSILNQTFQDFELIVVDNYSNYDFFAVIESFGDTRISAFQNQNEGVIAVNRNVGISYAIGEYLAFCDDDDIWLPNKLEVQLKLLADKKFDLVYSNTKLMFENGQFKDSNYANVNTLGKLLYHNQVTLSSVLVKKTKEIQFNEKKNFVALEDYELWIRLMLHGFRFKFVKIPLVKYRVTETSVSRQSKLRNEIINLKFRIILLREYRLSFFLKLVVFYRISISMIRYLVFSILKL